MDQVGKRNLASQLFFQDKDTQMDTSAAVYEMLWNKNFPAIQQGDVEVDPFLTNPKIDQRRGLTLIFRPSANLMDAILKFLTEIQKLEPDQYFYDASNLHFTVLPLFTAIPDHRANYARLPVFESAVQAALQGASAFTVQITGLTVSRGAVMLCGFTDSAVLNAIRDNLRQILTRNGFSAGLDQRYRLVTAHTTILRFSKRLRDPLIFSQFLQQHRSHDFGTFSVNELQLVKNDWYMSQEHTPIIARYALDDG
jgi:2'-5' RNA ligase